MAVVSLVAWGLLALATWQGWLGAPEGRGAEFCEASRGALVVQPINAASNLGFTLAAVAIAARASRSWSTGRTGVVSFAVLVTLLGPASAAMHATETAAGGHLDLLSMYLLAAFTASYALVRSGRLGAAGGGWLFVVLVVACEVIGSIPFTLPLLMHPGNAAFAILLLTSLALELGLVRRGLAEWRWGTASVVTLLLAFAVWSVAKDGSSWCSPTSLVQGHGIWHLLDALAAYFLARHYLAPDA